MEVDGGRVEADRRLRARRATEEVRRGAACGVDRGGGARPMRRRRRDEAKGWIYGWRMTWELAADGCRRSEGRLRARGGRGGEADEADEADEAASGATANGNGAQFVALRNLLPSATDLTPSKTPEAGGASKCAGSSQGGPMRQEIRRLLQW